MTNFPTKGEDKKISLRNSNYPQFDFNFASNVKEQTPEIWRAGGNIRGNEAFMLWGRSRDGQETEAITTWIKERESWAARHFQDGKQFKEDTEPNLSNVGGVVAQMKWGVIGNLGEQEMKDVILELTKKLEGKKEEKQLNETVVKALENKVEKHNEEIKELDLDWNARVTLKTLEEVMERGIGAYKTNPGSVRPNVSSPEQWGYARVNSFLFALKKGRFQGGKHDTDLLPNNHPIKEEMEENKNIMKKHDLRHIQKIEETDDSIIIYYGKAKEDVEMVVDMDSNIEEDSQEVRTITNKEIRTFNVSDIELRNDNGVNTVVGYGAVFNSESNDLGGFVEYVAPGAFDGRLEDDVRFLINHDGLPLARTTNGTLRLSVDERGLKYEADMPDTTLANDLMTLLRNGTISQSSFAFTVEEDSWENIDGKNVRTINKVSRLYDVSSVTYPAYNEAGSFALRSLENWQKEQEENKLNENLDKELKEVQKEEIDLRERSLNEMRLRIIKNK
jgi:HK97 family phage prohead protease